MSDINQKITYKSRNAAIRFDSYRVFSHFLHSKVKATQKKKSDDDDIVVRPHVASDGINSEDSLQSQDSNASTLEFGSNTSFAEETSGNPGPPATSHHVQEVGSSALAVAAQDNASSEPSSYRSRSTASYLSSDPSARNKKFADDIFGSNICLKTVKKQRDSLHTEKPSSSTEQIIFAQRPAAVSSTAASSQAALSTAFLRDPSYMTKDELSDAEKSREQPGTFRPPLGHREPPTDFQRDDDNTPRLDNLEITMNRHDDLLSDFQDRQQRSETAHNRLDFFKIQFANRMATQQSGLRADFATRFDSIRAQFINTLILALFTSCLKMFFTLMISFISFSTFKRLSHKTSWPVLWPTSTMLVTQPLPVTSLLVPTSKRSRTCTPNRLVPCFLILKMSNCCLPFLQ